MCPASRCMLCGCRRTHSASTRGSGRSRTGQGRSTCTSPLLHWVLPARIGRLILLDTDVVVVRDIRELHATFYAWPPSALVAVANEQSNLYAPLAGSGHDQDQIIGAVGKEQQSIGRVRRAGQQHAVTIHRIVLDGPNGERTLDRMLCERNQRDEYVKSSTNVGEACEVEAAAL